MSITICIFLPHNKPQEWRILFLKNKRGRCGVNPQDRRKKQCARLLLPGLLLFCLGLWQVLGAFWPAAVPADSPAEVTLPEEDTAVPTEKLIALTFDDGPHRVTTPKLLDGLAERGVHATFFLIGKQIADNAELVQRMDLMGHQIGLHTFDHVELTGLSPYEIRLQMDKTHSVLKDLLGREDFWVRPPYGTTDSTVAAAVGAPLVIWSVDPQDWKDDDVERIVSHVVENASDGDIILMHDIFPSSVEAALKIVDTLQAQGYRFVTVEELFAARGVVPEAGKRYSNAPPAS